MVSNKYLLLRFSFLGFLLDERAKMAETSSEVELMVDDMVTGIQ
jgi:hypothetical protein